jgi:hypothetical protein
VLVSVYPQADPVARACARALAVVALGGVLEMNWDEVLRVAGLPEYRNLEEARSLCGKSPMSSNSKVPSIPIEGSISYEDWLKGRRRRRELSRRVAPEGLRRSSSSSDRRLRRLFKGERGLPFTPMEKL